MSDEAIDEEPAARSRWRRFVIFVVVGLVLAVPVSVLWVLAASGGLRFRTPLADMEEGVALFEPPEGASLVNSNTYGSRVCFLQCSSWRFELEFVMEPGVAPEDLCDTLKPRADDWAGTETVSFGLIGPKTCLFGKSSFRGNGRWCAHVGVYDSSAAQRKGVDFYVILTQTC